MRSKKLAPELDKTYTRNKGAGLELSSVATMDKKADFAKYLRQNPFAHPVLFDDRHLNQSWHVVGVPAVFLVKNGQIAAQWPGVVKPDAVEAAVRGQVPGQPPFAPPFSPARGLEKGTASR